MIAQFFKKKTWSQILSLPNKLISIYLFSKYLLITCSLPDTLIQVRGIEQCTKYQNPCPCGTSSQPCCQIMGYQSHGSVQWKIKFIWYLICNTEETLSFLISCISVLVGTFKVYVLRERTTWNPLVAFHDLESCITLICAVGRARSKWKNKLILLLGRIKYKSIWDRNIIEMQFPYNHFSTEICIVH